MEPQKIILSRVMTPHGELQLQQPVGADDQGQPAYEIILNGIFLMASYNGLSERELAKVAIEPLVPERCGLHVLVGGLGVGYTLQAVLAWEAVHAVDVVEIEAQIIGWAKGYFSELNGHACSDPRVRVIEMDLADYIASTGKTYDVVILDVDNGPTWLALQDNRRLYEEPGLVKIRGLLRKGGVFVIWAAQRCHAFQRTLAGVFGRAELITVEDRDRRGRSTHYFLYRTQVFEGPSDPAHRWP